MTWQAVLIFLLQAACSQGLYQDTGNPYDEGPLMVESMLYNPSVNPLNPPPIHTRVHYPVEAGEYAILYFITGFGGINPGAIYEDVLKNISTHGFVVIAPWPVLGDDGPAFTWEEHLTNLDWLEENRPEDLDDGVMASFADVAVGCHSAGCTPTLYMALNRTGQIKSLLNLEPVSPAILDEQPAHYLPSFNYGAELANMSCSVPGRDFETWHSLLSCPKIMLELANVGHCDILDYEVWLTCQNLGFCVVGPEDQLTEYRMVMSGVSSAFLSGYLQGNTDQLEYITNPDMIPWTILQHDVNTDC